MIRRTHNLLLILVAAFTLTGCRSLAPRMAGPQFTGEIVASAAIAGGAPATEVMITPTRVASATSTPTASPTYTMSSTASIQPTATPSATASASPTQPAPTTTPAPTVTPTPAATATPEPPAVMVESAANVRSGPSTAYPIIGGVRVGQRLPVIGQYGDWWQITLTGRTGWIWGALVTPNAAAQQAPQVKDLPPLPPTLTPAPTGRALASTRRAGRPGGPGTGNAVSGARPGRARLGPRTGRRLDRLRLRGAPGRLRDGKPWRTSSTPSG